MRRLQATSPVSHACPRCGTNNSLPAYVDGKEARCASCTAALTPRRAPGHVLYLGLGNGECMAAYAFPRPGQPRHEHIDPRFDLWTHSPDGFAWGYSGSRPAQLALAILAHFLGPGREDLAVKLHQAFKTTFVAALPRNQEWVLTCDQIADWLHRDDIARAAVEEWLAAYPCDALTGNRD